MPTTRPQMQVPACPKCGGTRTTVTGKSEVPPMAYIRCESCGYITTVVTK